MSDLPLFYRSIALLDRDRHRDLALAQPQHFGFAKSSHLVPAVVDEFGPACRHLPIVFLPESLGPTPVFLAGFRPGISILIDEKGVWTGRYLPAYLRRYPFILGEADGAEPMICFDETAEGVMSRKTDEEGERTTIPLFEEEGQETPLLNERIGLVTDYAASARRTTAFGRTLQDLALLRPITVEGVQPGSSERYALHGFLAVDEAALAVLSDAGLLRLRSEGWLAVIYAHLISLQTVGDFSLPFVASSTPFAEPKAAA